MKKLFFISALFLCMVIRARAGQTEDFYLPIMGPSVHIYDPSVGEPRQWYINDHCLIKGADGKYHLFGITHEKEIIPPANYERQFAHASSPELFQVPWQKHPPALKYDRQIGETHVWAPHVIEKDGTYYMFYAAGGSHENSIIDLATSKDLFTWERPPVNPLFGGFYDARDPMVFKHGDEYLLYYCLTYGKTDHRSAVGLRRSKDLIHWSEPEFALVLSDYPRIINSGHTESPFVFEYQGKFYLTVCSPYYHYRFTRVFVSDNPFHFDEKDEITAFIAHCAEAPEFDGKFYLSHAGWFYEGVYLAPVNFHPAKKFDPQFIFANSGESDQYIAGKNKTRVAQAGIASRYSGNKLIRIDQGGNVRYRIPVPKDVHLMQLFVCGKGGYKVLVNDQPLKNGKDASSSEGLDLFWLNDPGLWKDGALNLMVSSSGGDYELNFLKLYFVQ